MALTSSLTTYIDDLALDDEFTDLGASRALTPADVINATVILFLFCLPASPQC